jgi:hypothetical protein
VALDDPGANPLQGAYRLTPQDNAEWQDKIKELLGRTSIIVLYVAEMTKAIEFELQVISLNSDTPILVVLSEAIFGNEPVMQQILTTLERADRGPYRILKFSPPPTITREIGAAFDEIGPEYVVARAERRLDQVGRVVARLWFVTPLVALIAGSVLMFVLYPNPANPRGIGLVGLCMPVLLFGLCAIPIAARTRMRQSPPGTFMTGMAWNFLVAALPALLVAIGDGESGFLRSALLCVALWLFCLAAAHINRKRADHRS